MSKIDYNKQDEEVYIANFKYEKGGIFRCLVWKSDELERPINLSRYINNPMDLKKQYEVLHVQNPYTSIVIETKNIVEIEIETIKRKEW